MQMSTRPLEKLTSITASLEIIIIIKAIYDTAFIHRQICPGGFVFAVGPGGRFHPLPLPCVIHISPDLTGHGKGE